MPVVSPISVSPTFNTHHKNETERGEIITAPTALQVGGGKRKHKLEVHRELIKLSGNSKNIINRSFTHKAVARALLWGVYSYIRVMPD